MEVKGSRFSQPRTYEAGYKAGFEAAKKECSEPSLGAMDKITIGGAGLVGGAASMIPLFGSAASLGAFAANQSLDNKVGSGLGALGALANVSSLFFADIPDKTVAGAMIMACLLTAGVAGGISSATAAHSYALSTK